MSEIAKCPLCGDEPNILFDLFDKREEYPKGYSCCEVECRTLTTWNQYAAAMDLAKATADTDGRTDIPLALILAPYVGRVLEVFNG